MLEITVKTIDGQNRSYSMPDNHTIKQFKEKIAASMNIPVDRQRLIFQGRVLKDEKLLSECDLNGKTIHLVERTAPPPPATASASATQGAQQSQQHHTDGITEETNIFIGGFPFGAQATGGSDATGGGVAGGIQSIIQQILGGLAGFDGATGAAAGTPQAGGATGLPPGVNITTNNRNLGLDIQIDLSNMSQAINEEEIRGRIRNVRKMLSLARARLNRLREIQSGVPLEDNFPMIQQMMQVDDPQQPQPQSTEATSDTAEPSATTPQPITVDVLSELITSVNSHYQEFLPYLMEYNSLLVNDAQEPVEADTGENRRQRFCNNINDMMHLMGHLFHNLSDLHINLRERAPRSMRTMAPMTTAIMTATPYEANIQIPVSVTMPAPSPSTPSSTTTTTAPNGATTSTTSSATTTTTSRTTTTTTTTRNADGTTTTTTSTNDSPAVTQTPINIGQPVTYVEYSPNAITLNQISAQLIDDFIPQIPPPSSVIPTTNTTASTTPPAPTPDTNRLPTAGSFAQNIQSLANFLLRRTPGASPNPNTTATSNGTPTNTQPTQSDGQRSRSTSRDVNDPLGNGRASFRRGFYRSTQGGGGGASAAPGSQLPGASAFGGQSTAFDPFLPCNSVHFLNSSISVHPIQISTTQIIPTFQRFRVPNPAAQPAGGNATTTTTSSSTTRRRHPAGNQRTSATGTTPQDFSSLLFGPFTRNSSTQSASATSSATTTTPTSRLTNFNDLINLLQVPGVAPASATAQNEQFQFLDLLRNAFGALNTNNPNDERLNMPLSNLLNTAADTTPETESNYLIEIFYTLFSSMTLLNMLNLVMGQNVSVCFQNSRGPLKTLIKTKVLKEQPGSSESISEQSIDNVTNLICADILQDLNKFLTQSDEQGRQDETLLKYELIDKNLDYYASFQSLFSFYVKKLLTHIYNDGLNDTVWSTEMYDLLKEFRNQIIGLFRSLFKNSNDLLIDYICGKLDRTNENIFNNIFNTFTRTTLNDILTGIQPNMDDVKRFVQTSRPQQSSIATATSSSNDEQKPRLEALPSLSTSSEMSSVDSDDDTPMSSNDASFVDIPVVSPLPATGSSWQSIVPDNWAQIIENDIEKQREHRQQQLYSDAYMSGVTNKKRK